MILNIKRFPNGKWKENCYIINKPNKDALIIDPGGDEDKLIKYIKLENLNILGILNTHGHYDHIGAVKKLKKKFDVPFFIHSRDEKLLKTANLYKLVFDSNSTVEIPKIDHYFDKEDIKNYFIGFSIEIIFTPGHTEGSVCILIEDNLFSGDTILKGEIGRVDLPGGDRISLKNSLRIISDLPKKTKIFPGHGVSTTIGYELKNNNKLIRDLK